MLKKTAVGIVFLCSLFAAQAADACVEISFLAAPVSMNYPILLPTGSPVFANPKIGIYQWQDVTGTYIYESFCIDLETVGEGSAVVFDCVELTDARDPSLTGGQLSQFRADLLELLWAQFRWAVVGVEEAAAFQLAIYEIVYDGDDMTFGVDGLLEPGQDFAGGLVDCTNGGSAQWAIAEGWLYSLDLNGAVADLIAWHSDERQDQIVERFFHPVPVKETTWGGIKSMYRD
jgi:hypothetical protein